MQLDSLRVTRTVLVTMLHGMRVFVLSVAAAELIGCGSDTMGFDPVLDDHEFYANLVLSPRAINLGTASSYNTVQLHAAPVFADGQTVPGTVTYTSNNPVITVSATGLLTATDSTAAPSTIYVSMTYHGITRQDSAIVNVIHGAPAAPLQRISIQPLPGDSAKVGAGGAIADGSALLNVTNEDALGNPIPGLVIDFTSSDSLTAKVTSPGIVVGNRPGKVTLYATTYAFGVTKTDSLPYIVGQSIGAIVSTVSRIPDGSKQPVMAFDPGTVTIGTGGSIVWFNTTITPVDVTFDDPSNVIAAVLPDFYNGYFNGHPGGGNIAAFHAEYDSIGALIFASQAAARTFSKAGTYTYHSRLYGTTGTITVCDERVSLCLH